MAKNEVAGESSAQGQRQVSQKPAKQSAKTQPKPKTGKKPVVKEQDVHRDATPQKQNAQAKQRKRDGNRAKPPADLVVGRVVALLCTVAAFVGVVMLYRYVFPPVTKAVEGDSSSAEMQVVQGDEAVQASPEYQGVDDPWTTSKYFTTGDKNLDEKVKRFCDDLTEDGATASSNAQTVFNNLMWNYSYSDQGQNKPAGPEWDIACARDFLNRYEAAGGLGGEADYYELAAVTSFCLRYFGFTDALAVPVVLSASGSSDGYETAYCLVTSEMGAACICDPTLGANGWMLDRYSYTFMVDDIGQDLTQFEAMGLQIKRQDDSADAKKTDAAENETGIENGTSAEDGTTTEYGYEYEQEPEVYYLEDSYAWEG